MPIFSSESVKLLSVVPKHYFHTGYVPLTFILKAEYRGDGISFFDIIDLNLYRKFLDTELYKKNADLELYKKMLDLGIYGKDVDLELYRKMLDLKLYEKW